MEKRDFTKLLDINRDEATHLLERAHFLKELRKEGRTHAPLTGKSLAMVFEKASTRTRVSFEIGMWELGGYAIFLSGADTQIGRGEPVRDTARVLSRYVDAIMVRTYGQSLIEELARWAEVPIINALSDLYHPCQILSDLYTIGELRGAFDDLKIVYIGDGNNVANSWLEAAILFDLNFAIAVPEGYEPDRALLDKAGMNERFSISRDPFDAVKGADVIYTDVWVSMGQEKEKEEREKVFSLYRIDSKLLENAARNAIVMHCLPAYRNKEITDEVFEAHQDVIFRQAENRLHCQKALLEWLIFKQ